MSISDLVYPEQICKQFAREGVANANKKISQALPKVIEQHNPTCQTDLNGQIIYANSKFCLLHGGDQRDLLGKPLHILDSHNNAGEFGERIWRVISSGQIWSGKTKGTTKNGNTIWLEATIFPIRNHQARVIAFTVVITDITRETQLRYKNLELTRALQEEKARFLRKKIAFDEVLGHIEAEKLKVTKEIATNFEVSIFPLLDQITSACPKQEKYLNILKQSLQNISKPIIEQTRDWRTELTAKETQICSMIKQGLTVKEIAPLMHLSPRTVEKHRENIRKKLGIKERKMNLSTYLINQRI